MFAAQDNRKVDVAMYIFQDSLRCILPHSVQAQNLFEEQGGSEMRSSNSTEALKVSVALAMLKSVAPRKACKQISKQSYDCFQ